MKRRGFTVPRKQYCDCDLCRAGVSKDPAAVRAYMKKIGAGRSPRYGREIKSHLLTHFGDVGSVLGRNVAGGNRFEIFVLPPTRKRPWFLLATAGLSDKTMTAPAEAGTCECHAELMIALPPNWRFNRKSLERERFRWPIRLLLSIADYVHEDDPWVWFHHTMSNQEPYAPNVPFSSVLFHHPELIPEETWRVRTDGGPDIWFIALLPLFPAEQEYWAAHGAHALFDLLLEAEVTELVDLGRKPVVWS